MTILHHEAFVRGAAYIILENGRQYILHKYSSCSADSEYIIFANESIGNLITIYCVLEIKAGKRTYRMDQSVDHKMNT
jgi:hypothetical protein